MKTRGEQDGDCENRVKKLGEMGMGTVRIGCEN